MKYARRLLKIAVGSIVLAIALTTLLVLGEVGSAFAYVTWATPPRAEIPEKTAVVAPKLVVLGDSLGQGFRATPGHGWVDIFAQRLSARYPHSRVYNLSVGGSRVGDLKRELYRAPAHPDAVLIVAGGNDLMFMTPPYALAINERVLLETVRTKFPHANIVLTNVPDISWRSFPIDGRMQPLPLPFRAIIGRATDVDNAIIDRTAARSGARLIDLHGLTLRGADGKAGIEKLSLEEFSRRYIAFDGLHPSDAGYAMLADYAWPEVARALRIEP